jgi:hypothetical protein
MLHRALSPGTILSLGRKNALSSSSCMLSGLSRKQARQVSGEWCSKPFSSRDTLRKGSGFGSHTVTCTCERGSSPSCTCKTLGVKLRAAGTANLIEHGYIYWQCDAHIILAAPRALAFPLQLAEVGCRG